MIGGKQLRRGICNWQGRMEIWRFMGRFQRKYWRSDCIREGMRRLYRIFQNYFCTVRLINARICMSILIRLGLVIVGFEVVSEEFFYYF